MYLLKIGPAVSELSSPSALDGDAWKLAASVCSFQKEGAEHMPSFQSGRWDGRVRLGSYAGGKFLFPSGLAPSVIQAFVQKFGHSKRSLRENVETIFQSIVLGYEFPKSTVVPLKELGGRIELRDYQKRMVDSIALYLSPLNVLGDMSSGVALDTDLRLGGRGIWKAATGSGKTVACAGLIGKLGVKTLFLVNSNDLVLQTKEVFSSLLGPWLGETGWELGLASEGVFCPGDITVAGTATMTTIIARPERLIKDLKETARAFVRKKFPSLLENGREVQALLDECLALLRTHPSSLALKIQNVSEDANNLDLVFSGAEDLAFIVESKRVEAEEAWSSLVQSLSAFSEKYLYALERLRRLEEYLEQVEFLILDEAHGGAASGIYDLLMRCNAPYRLAMSGTPLDRSDGANLQIIAAFGDIVAHVSNAEMQEAGVVPSATICMVPVRGRLKMWKGYRYNDVYRTGIAEYEERNERIVDLIRGAYEQEKRVLLLFRAHTHGERLSEMLHDVPHDRVDGRDSVDYRKEVIERFRAGVTSVVLASEIFGTGINIPEGIDVLINASGGKATIGTLQRLGRGLRGDGHLVLYDFADYHHKMLARHSLKRLEIYQNQGCFDIQVMS